MDHVELLLSWSFTGLDLSHEEWKVLLQPLTDSDTNSICLNSLLSFCDDLNRAAKEVQHGGLRARLMAQHWVFDGNGFFMKVWKEIMTLNALYYFLSVPYTLAFLRTEILTTYASTLWVAYAVDCLLLVDMCIKLNTSFLDPASSVQVLDRRRIRQRYLSTEFVVDVRPLICSERGRVRVIAERHACMHGVVCA